MQTVLENVLDNEPITHSERIWTASELRKLPAAERDAVLLAAAALAEAEYRNGPELTAFDAFGDDDLFC